MFGIGLWEIVAIGVVAVVLIRPRDLPAILRKVGRGYGRLVRLRESALRTARDLESEIRRYGAEAAEERGRREAGGQERPEAGEEPQEDGAAALYRRLHEENRQGTGTEVDRNDRQ